MRLFMVCLLSLGIAVQGHAGVRMMDAGCPMLHAAVTTAHAGQGSMQHMHGHHMDTTHADVAQESAGHDSGATHAGHEPAGHGQHCKHDVGCQSAAPAIAATIVILPTATPAMQAPAALAPSFRSHIPPLLARPPALA